MVNIRQYVTSNFTKSLLGIFLPVFFVISLIYVIKLSALTAQITISLSELLHLYTYFLPDIIFYTLPFSFITALGNTFSKLSTDNELIALHALGFQARSVVRKLILPTLLFSALLLSVALIGMPLGKQASAIFKENKRAEANFNIVPGKIGQQFGDFYIYVKEKEGDLLHDVVIYNQSSNHEEEFFSAKTGKIMHEDGTPILKLSDGYGYTYSEDKLRQTQYKEMKVYDRGSQNTSIFKDIPSYWAQIHHDEQTRKRLLFYLFTAAIPIIALYIIASFTMINPRYQTNHATLTISLVIFTLYVIALVIEKKGNFYILALAVIALLAIGRWLFKKRVERYF